MCRMFGTVGYTNSQAALACISRLVPGGPDEQNLRWGNGWLLGHTRLSINGVLNGSQPFTAHGLQCLFVGEIYNYRDLAKRYALPLSPDPSDGEVILPLYDRFGASFVELLEGMFSIAILDTRRTMNLFLFTDPCAVKPVYYKRIDDGVSFASEIEGIPTFSEQDRRVSVKAFDRYGAFRAFLGAQTIFPNIRVLEPSNYLHFDGHRSFIRCYQPVSENFERSWRPERQFCEDFADAVHGAMMTDVPICTTLSGGLDSSLVATIAAQDARMTDAFNVWYEGKWNEDETKFASEVANCAELQFNHVIVENDRFPDLIIKMCRSLSQPNAAAHCLSTFRLYEAISKRGFKVALVGEGADDFFGGYDRIVKVALDKTRKNLDAYVDDLCAIPGGIRRKLIFEDARNDDIPEDAKAFIRSLPGSSTFRKVLHFESRHRLPYYILHRVDALSMAHSVEARVPYCFSSVYRHALIASDFQLISASGRKKPIYDAGRGILPSTVINRAKQPFLLPIAGMLAPGYPVYEFLMDTISSNCKTSHFVNFVCLTDLIERNRERPNNKLGNAIWAWLIYEIWAQEHGVSFA